MEKINPQTYPEFQYFVHFLEKHGIPFSIGTNANKQTIFELYLPDVNRPEGQTPPTIGASPEREVGNLYFLMHDAVHHIVGIPGPRLSDLKNREAAKKRLIEIMLMKEQVATSHSLMDYARYYWNWRDEVRHGKLRPEFKELNRGAFPFGIIPRSDYVEIIGHFVHGRTWEYSKILRKYLDAGVTEKARRVGIPNPAQNFSKFLGFKGEALAYKFLIPIVEPILARYREVGYGGFLRYSTAMADFMLQDWYVEWADRFQFGYSFDQLEARGADALRKLKRGEYLGDASPAKPLEFDLRYLQNQVSLFGRRIMEVRELGRQGNSRKDFNAQDEIRLKFFYEQAAKLNDELRSADVNNLSAEKINSWKSQFQSQMESCAKEFSVEKYIPFKIRQPFINYDHYWFDMTALAMPRYGHNSAGSSPGGIKEMVVMDREAQRGFWGFARAKMKDWYMRNIMGIPDLWNFQKDLASDYEKAQEEGPPLEFKSDTEGLPVYIQRLRKLSDAIAQQVELVVLPQILEGTQLDVKTREAIKDSLDGFVYVTTLRTVELEALYENTFEKKGATRSPSTLLRSEELRLHQFFDRSYDLILELLDANEEKQSAEKLGAIAAKLEEINRRGLTSGEAFPAKGTSKDIAEILPVKGSLKFTIPSFIKKALYKSKISSTELLGKLSATRLWRAGNQYDVKLTGWDPVRAPEESSVFVLALNHEQGPLDSVIGIQTLKKMGATRVILLATRSAIQVYQKANYSESDVVFIEDERPIDQLLQKVMAAKDEKIGVLIFPEGVITNQKTWSPMSAKAGAFVFARRAAEKMSPSKSVYLITGQHNGLEHFTDEERKPYELDLEIPQWVPAHPVSNNDDWVNEQRLRFENRTNHDRASQMIDLIHRKLVPGTKAYLTAPLKPYLTFSKWFHPSVIRKCARPLEIIGRQKVVARR